MVTRSQLQWRAAIDGPDDSPFEGRTFLLDIEVPDKYPFQPPKFIFTTNIYHLNMNDRDINLDVLRIKQKYFPSLTIMQLLVSIRIVGFALSQHGEDDAHELVAHSDQGALPGATTRRALLASQVQIAQGSWVAHRDLRRQKQPVPQQALALA